MFESDPIRCASDPIPSILFLREHSECFLSKKFQKDDRAEESPLSPTSRRGADFRLRLRVQRDLGMIEGQPFTVGRLRKSFDRFPQ